MTPTEGDAMYQPTDPTYTEDEIRDAIANVAKAVKKVAYHIEVDLDDDTGTKLLKILRARVNGAISAIDVMKDDHRRTKAEWNELRADILDYVHTTPAN